MPKPLEIFWEVGKELWKNKWERGEFVKSPKFPITDTCSLEIYFYPEGLEDNERPLFKRVRSNTDEWMNIKGDIQLCHGVTIAKWYILDDVFEKGEDCATYGLEDIPKLSKFRIFHSLPDLCYRLIFTVSTDEAAYAKRSTKLKAESSDPNANSIQQSETSEPEVEIVYQTKSSEPESADSLRQTESSDPKANKIQQSETLVPEVEIDHQNESSEPEVAYSVRQTESSDPNANSVQQPETSELEIDIAHQTESSKPEAEAADSVQQTQSSEARAAG